MSRLRNRVLAITIAATTVFSSVVPGSALAAEQPVAVEDGVTEAAVEAVEETESQEELSEEASEEKTAVQEETAGGDGSSEESTQEQEKEEPAPSEEEKTEKETTSDAEADKKQEDEVNEDAGSDVIDGTQDEEQGQDPEVTDEDPAAPAEGTEPAAEEELPAEDPVPAEEKPEEEVIEVGRFALRFDSEGGIVKVVVSSDDGANDDDPSYKLEKKDGTVRVTDRSGNTQDAAITGDGYVLDIELKAGTTVKVISEAAEGFHVETFKVTADAGPKDTGFDGEEEEYSYTVDVAKDDHVVADVSFAETKKEEPKEEKAQEGIFGLNLESAGGFVKVTVTGTEEDAESASYTIRKSEDGSVSVDTEGTYEAADSSYSFSIKGTAGSKINIYAEADQDTAIDHFTVTSPDGSVREADLTKAFIRNRLATVSTEIAEGTTEANIAFDQMPTFDAEKAVGNITVKIHAEKGVLPAGTTADVRKMTDAEAAAYMQKAQSMTEGAVPVAAVDITFRDKNGQEIQPDGSVQVSFLDAKIYDEVSVFHAVDGDVNKMEEMQTEVDGKDVSVESDSFSPFMLLAAAGEPDWTQGGAGTKKKVDGIKITCKDREDYTYGGHDYGDWLTLTYNMYDDKGNKVGKGRSVCMDPKLDGGPAGDTYECADGVYQYDAPMLKKAMYYDNVAADVYRESHGYVDARGVNILMHAATAEIYARLGYAYKSSVGDYTSGASDLLINDVKEYVSRLNNLTAPDDYFLCVAQYPGSCQDFGFSSVTLENKGKISLRKTGKNGIAVTGAEYGVWNRPVTLPLKQEDYSNGYIAYFKIGSDGVGRENWNNGTTLEVDANKTYYIVETKLPTAPGYRFDTKVYTATPAPGATVTITSDEPTVTISLTLTKKAAHPADIRGNSNYSLAGAVYGVYTDKACTKGIPGATRLTTKADGTSNVIKGLAPGKYYLKEITPPKGFKKSSEVIEVDASDVSSGVPASGEKAYTATATEEEEHVDLTLIKASTNPGVSEGNKCYSLAGGKFGVYTDEACTKSVGTLTTKADGTSTTLKNLYLGTYYVKELEAPKGFRIRTEIPLATVNATEGERTYTFRVNDAPAFDPTPIILDKKNKNEDEQLGRSLAGAVFTVRYYDGYYTASNLPSSAEREWEMTTKEEVVSGKTIYRAKFEDATGDDFYTSVGGVKGRPLGTVVFTEKSPAPGYKNDPDFGDGVDKYIIQFVQNENGGPVVKKVIQGTSYVTNTLININAAEPPLDPVIGTTATDANSGKHLSLAGSEVTINDKVIYENLIPGMKYIISGRMVDKDTGETLSDADGKEVTAEKEFTASEKIKDSVTLSFTFNTDSSFEGKSIVAYEVLTGNEPGRTDLKGARHEDIDDEGQTIRFPKLGTTALDKTTGIKNTLADGEQTIVDTIAYEGLVAGDTYTVSGVLMDKATGEPLMVDGEEITSSKEFTADAESGTVEVEFTFDATGLDNKDLVVFEEVYANGALVGQHKDINDEKQTDHIPDVRTTAADSETKEQNSLPDEDSTIVDIVYYSNLIPGKTYEITGKVMDKESEEELDPASYHQIDKDGNKIDAFSFTPSEKSGSVEIYFKVEATALKGKDVVVFEDLLHENKKVAVHADITDENQTVHYPDGHTLALDTKTGIKNALAEEDTIFEDTFTYSNLLPGKTYRITGKVMNKETGEEIPSVMTDKEGNPVEAGYFEFVPEEKDGETVLYFKVDASTLENVDAVVFETVSLNGAPVIIHEDINDEAQTMYIPEGRTTAIDSETQTQLSLADEEVTIIDTFVFKNLIPGTEYTMTGRVMKKSDASEVPAVITDAQFGAAEEGEEVSPEISFTEDTVTFTPATADGSVIVSFTFDASALAGEDVVVFERAYHEGTEVIVHENIDDKNQTVHVPDGQTQAQDPDTGSQTMEALDDIIIKDVFAYENLMAGKEYTITAKVMLKPEGEGEGEEIEAQLVDEEGNPLDEYRFTASAANGSESLYFKVNAAALAGKSIVFFERLQYEGLDIVIHEDINDDDQTVHFPDGHTTATDSETKDHIANADSEITILDELFYTNLIPGKTYVVKGVLMDKDGNVPIVDAEGNEVVREVEFIPETADGSTIIEFTFDGSNVAGKRTVAFETVYSEGKQVFVHADLNDEEQEVDIPGGHTTATDSETGNHTANADEMVTIVDEVFYTNLLPGKTYTLTGVLMDKETGKPLVAGGKTVENTTTFKAKEKDGSVKLEFTFDASALAGKKVVAFETVFYNDKEVFVHADLEDRAQTVDFPSVKTNATDKADGDKKFTYQGTVTVNDHVDYTNLTVGSSYKVTGVLMDKKTGRPAMSGGKQITGEATFVAPASDGSIDVAFTFNAADLKEGEYVVYEELYEVLTNTKGKVITEVIVGTHKDINDEAQMVTRVPNPPKKTKTGDTSPIFPLVAALAVGILGAAGTIVYRKKKRF